MSEESTQRWIFLRHGESTANAAGTLSGHLDVGLTAKGKTQADAAGEALREVPIDLVLSSDLGRAMETARRVMEARPAPLPLEIHPELRERHLGDYQGRRLSDLRASGANRLLIRWDGRPPGGAESLADLAHRALPLLARYARPATTTLVVGHGGLLRVVLGLLDGLPTHEIGPRKLANATPVERQVPVGRWAALLDELQVSG